MRRNADNVSCTAPDAGATKSNKKGRTSFDNPPLQPTTKVSLVVAILRRAPEEQLGRRRRNARFRYIGRELSIRGWDQTDRALGIVPPTIRVRIFFTALMQAGDLIFQTSAVALLENRRCDKDQQVTFGARVEVLLEKVAEDRDVSHHGNFISALRHFVLKQPTDRKGVTTLDQDIGIQGSRVDDRTRDRCTSEDEGCVRHLVADLGFDAQGDKIILIDRRPDDKGIAKFLVLESAEDRGRGLLIEIQLRDRLVTNDLDLRLLIIRRHNSGISKELRVRILIQEPHGKRHLRDRKDCELVRAERTPQKFAEIVSEVSLGT